MKYGVLEGKQVVPIDVDLKTEAGQKEYLRWASWFQSADRRVSVDEIGDARISTVFLGLDHSWSSRPLWFETRIFGGPHDQHQDRYSTWEEAISGHEKAIALAREGLI